MINVPDVANKSSDQSQSAEPAAPPLPRDAEAAHPPLAQLLVLLPLVLFYEVAITLTTLESGWYHRIDAWSRAALGRIGLTAYYLPGLAILVTLLAWHLLRGDPWKLDLRQMLRMWIEAALLAVPLFVLYLLFTLPWATVLGAAGEPLQIGPGGGPDDLFSSVVLAIGAGLFEEFVFRLVLVSALVGLLHGVLEIRLDAVQLVAICVTAALFAAAHHFGPGAAAYGHVAFLWRVAAGIYLGSVFILRGFATAAIAHAGFNIALAVLAVT